MVFSEYRSPRKRKKITLAAEEANKSIRGPAKPLYRPAFSKYKGKKLLSQREVQKSSKSKGRRNENGSEIKRFSSTFSTFSTLFPNPFQSLTMGKPVLFLKLNLHHHTQAAIICPWQEVFQVENILRFYPGTLDFRQRPNTRPWKLFG